MDIMKHGEETAEEIEAAFVGVNNGVSMISKFRRRQPTVICGTGRSGTTALARCFLNSDDVKFVTQDETDGSNLEVIAMNKATVECDAEAWRAFKEEHAVDDSEFVCKQPRFEEFIVKDEDFKSVWTGANIIVMTRDPHLVATRQWSINMHQSGKTFTEHVASCFAIARRSIMCAAEMSELCGVLFVSYEKLITQPQQVADEVNAWFGRERLMKKAMAKSIMPNNPYYLERQTLGWMRQMKDMKERRARGER